MSARPSRRAWSGGTGKHGGPQTGTAYVLDRVELPPPEPIPPATGTTPPVLLLTGSAAAPAVVVMPGAWGRRFKSPAAALEWCSRLGFTIKNRPEGS